MAYQIKRDLLEELILQQRTSRKNVAKKAELGMSTISYAVHRGCRQETIQRIGKALEMPNWRDLLLDKDRERLDSPPGIPPGADTIPLYMFYRVKRRLRDEYYRAALASGRRVLYVSIMSRHSFKLLRTHLAEKTQLTVLAWNPATAAEIVGFSKHLSEGDDKIEQAQGALEEWDKLSTERPSNVAVYTYESTPTMQGIIVEKRWAMIELMPYAMRPRMRPAILLRQSERAERKAFKFFSECFQGLLRDAHHRTPGDRSPWFPDRSDRRGAFA